MIAELRATWPDRQIDVDLDLPRPVDCDRARIAQLLSNLVANALTHGADAPVKVRASRTATRLELSVENQGDAIPPDVLARLFEPFTGARPDSRNQGLGLGLYIASEIARAHNGELTVASRPRRPASPSACRCEPSFQRVVEAWPICPESSAQQRLGVRVLGLAEQRGAGSRLDDLAVPHHGNVAARGFPRRPAISWLMKI